MSANPYESPETVANAEVSSFFRISTAIKAVAALCALCAVMCLCVLPEFFRFAPGAARRAQCSSNLRQIAIAVHNYHDEYGCLPPAYTVDAKGKPLHSWRTLILPYLEQQLLYDQIDLSKPWDDPANQAIQDAKLSVYRCPSVQIPHTQTTYLAVVAPGGCFLPTESRRFSEITDGAAATIMVVEVDAENAVPWMSPVDAGEELILALGKCRHPPHTAGAQVAFVDAHVQLLTSDVKPDTRRALISIAGNEKLPDDF